MRKRLLNIIVFSIFTFNVVGCGKATSDAVTEATDNATTPTETLTEDINLEETKEDSPIYCIY